MDPLGAGRTPSVYEGVPGREVSGGQGVPAEDGLQR